MVVTDVVLVSAIMTRYPEKILVRPHVSNFHFHGLPKDQKLRHIWHQKKKKKKVNTIILKVPRSKYVPIILKTENVHFGVLSQHFCWQKVMWKHNNHHKRCQTLRTPENNGKKKRKVVKSETSLCDQTFSLSLASVQLTRDADVPFYTSLSNTNVSKTLFDHLIPKASVMHYWKGPRQTLKEAPMRYSMADDSSLFLKPGPGRIPKLEL
jgi:hypothetical protein